MSQSNSVVLQEKLEDILLVTINRPEAGNSVNGEVATLIDEAVTYGEQDPDIKAIILTGAGDKIFCGGFDLKFLAANGKEAAKAVSKGNRGFAGITQRKCPKVLICAVNGKCMGGGTEMALACDFIIAAEHASLGLPEVKLGIFGAAGGPIRLARQLPRAIALEIALTGEPISAQRAYEVGMVSRVVPREKLLEEAIAFARRITCNSAWSISVTKQLINASLDLSLEQAFNLSDLFSDLLENNPASLEGAKAFVNKPKK
jgi:crotonobetainyl-CoA hydratase